MSVSIQWFGRAWFRIEAQGRVVHIDPAYAKTYVADHEKQSDPILERLCCCKADTLEKPATSSPEELLARMIAVNEEQQITKASMPTEDLGPWLETAKLIEY
jgi:hypothetical protein